MPKLRDVSISPMARTALSCANRQTESGASRLTSLLAISVSFETIAKNLRLFPIKKIDSSNHYFQDNS